MKCEKKEKIVDMLTKLRKKKKLSMIKDLNLYRVRYDYKARCYIYSLIPPEDYTTDIFFGSKNKTSAIFFLCNNKDPRKPILTKYTVDERKSRAVRCNKYIDFVKRRDLNKQYI